MNTLVITFITACTALVAALVGPLISLRLGRAQINATVLSANRQKWIDGFRELVALFCSQATAAALLREKIVDQGRGALADDPALIHRLEQITLTFAKIRLMANLAEEDHRALIQVMAGLMERMRDAPRDADMEAETQMATEQVIVISQALLKREWLRVKQGR